MGRIFETLFLKIKSYLLNFNNFKKAYGKVQYS